MLERTTARQMLGFVVVGAANTALGLGVVLALQLGLGVHPHLANAAGYLAGFALGFTLNRRFVFGAPGSLLRYGAAALAAFALNQAVLAVAGRALGPEAFGAVAAQGLAIGSCTLAFFLLCRGWVFRPREQPA